MTSSVGFHFRFFAEVFSSQKLAKYKTLNCEKKNYSEIMGFEMRSLIIKEVEGQIQNTPESRCRQLQYYITGRL